MGIQRTSPHGIVLAFSFLHDSLPPVMVDTKFIPDVLFMYLGTHEAIVVGVKVY